MRRTLRVGDKFHFIDQLKVWTVVAFIDDQIILRFSFEYRILSYTSHFEEGICYDN